MLNQPGIPEVSVQALNEMIENGQSPNLLDVRQVAEHEQANIGGRLIQLDQLPHRIDELDISKGDQLIVYCRSGARSGRAVEYLQALGYTGARNLRGGMMAWRAEIDPTMIVG